MTEQPAYQELRLHLDGLLEDIHCVLSAVGEKCAGAADRPACQRAYAAIVHPLGSSFTTTDRWTVRNLSLASPEFLALLGTVDTEQEAVLVARSRQYPVDCSVPPQQRVYPVPGGYEVVTRTGTGCGPGNDIYQHTLRISDTGTASVLRSTLIKPGDPNCVIGRRPAGLCVSSSQRADNALGAYFAAMAELEASAVLAFRMLEQDLAEHRAPVHLLQQARQAAQDERRHTRITGQLARRFAARPGALRVPPHRCSSLEDLARENEIEGCVRETFGALVGLYQAEHAQDPAIRQSLCTLAADELRHAALAWQVRAWLTPRLGADARHQVQLARQHAIATLRAELAIEPDQSLVTAAGVPTAFHAHALLTLLEHSLWAPTLAA